MQFQSFINLVGETGDIIGVVIIATGFVWGLAKFVLATLKGQGSQGYDAFRVQLVRALLLGLEVLVASDIIRTVAISPSLQSVSILAAIVLIRTFLSWSLILESEGRWPWQPAKNDGSKKV
ncbi:DUF1622 domain-containing protein [Orrella sp. NBD-18]|uniref:DUF1622 domain-containing protein n=1 Tax=Sheuella amnicola TaxID=2707330 RepID=A0A6B2QZI5_9BURK|nr:DUF1622 domain-containing protein [Sheuella amnicola]NDY83323.1 DUF1622 domain-containing protein [Sheuella amnicola]HBI82110.1 hypothetical protein [Alcaligenaceae bacterium]